MGTWGLRCAVVLLGGMAFLSEAAQADFVNFESPQVHPLDMNVNRSVLAACNTADNRIEVYSLTSGAPVHTKSIPVGLDPVSVRFTNNTGTKALVVNHMSDTVSYVDITLGAVIKTIDVPDEPCDVVAAGGSGRAFVTCSQPSIIAVIDFLNTGAVTDELKVACEEPRALALSPDKSTVYAAAFESGNRSTLLGGGSGDPGVLAFPPNVVSNGSGPAGGANPPFNDAGGFFPPKNPANGPAPDVALIVKQDDDGDWLDDSGRDWSNFVDGPQGAASGRPVGWTLLDHDIVVINASTLDVSYVDTMMNINMAMGVNPVSGLVSLVGTEAINEVRFEPNVNGIFVRVMMATANASGRVGLKDLNEDHLAAAQQAENGVNNAYHDPRVPLAERAKSIGDPRAIAWNSTGNKAYIAGMGSNNVIVVDSTGQRAGVTPTIDVREGPTGLVVDDNRNQLYVLNRFHGSLSVVDLTTEQETQNLPFHDPTPVAIKKGRKHLYDTHKTSGLGQVSCGACHVDARFDRLAWDLGDPAGMPKPLDGLNLGGGIPLLGGELQSFEDFHPMKGPMTTQTLIGIIGHEPFHWRGDRLGLEEFNPAFQGLLGDENQLTPQEMQEFEDFLATIHFPPNPYRNDDNTLPTNLPLDGHYATGDNDLPAGTPLPNGNAVNGLFLYRGAPGPSGTPTRLLDQEIFTCVTCHTLPSGDGTRATWNGSSWSDIPLDPLTGSNHVALVSVDGSTNVSIKVPHLQPVYDKIGFSMVNKGGDKTSTAGFGYVHDGSVDTLERFFAMGGPHDGAFRFEDDQEVADMVAFMLSLSGDDLPDTGPLNIQFNPPGTKSPDVHAAVGKQLSFTGLDPVPVSGPLVLLDDNSDRIELILVGRFGGEERGFLHVSGKNYTQDINDSATISLDTIIAERQESDALTFTIVPAGTGERMALDRDGDGYYNKTELIDGSDPADPASFGPQEGEGDGVVEGSPEGTPEGTPDGTPEGIVEGNPEGTPEGTPEGVIEGNPEGTPEGVAEGVVEGTPEGEGEGRTAPPFNSTDQDENNAISLSELLRPIQFYNANGYSCASEGGGEDVYTPGFGNCSACADYSGDYMAPFCRITLSELLRMIQIFNVGTYHPCDDPDFFCPGTQP